MRWKYSKVSHIFLKFETKTIWLFYLGYFPFAWRVLQKIPTVFSQWCYVNLTDSRLNRIWSCTSPELWIFTSRYTEVVLFFFSFKSPAVFIFNHARSTDFEQKIEGLWTGSIFTGHAWSYETGHAWSYDLFLIHIRVFATVICNQTATTFAELLINTCKDVGFYTQLITEKNCWSSPWSEIAFWNPSVSQLVVDNWCRKKTRESRSSEMNNTL